ncbi:hypothetical protein CRG98_004636 [Punica granatum]|uniref:BZIP domain-containing protein n=1 Tax=Punica granatum TaxID=22663 RepID=A0A2I0L2C2_PUNGR|nr:hypothetical protein CRG98_004636 [Punica granatum]
MACSKGSSDMRSVMYSGKHALLPPKSPFPSLSPAYADYVPNPPVATKAVQRPREGYAHHQRTSSESFLMEEQPSWLDDLLNEPETPVRKGGHRRSSSDSFAYIDVASIGNLDYMAQGDYKYRNMVPKAGWRSQDFDHRASLHNELKYVKHKNKPWESPVHASPHASSGLPSAKDNVASQNSGPSCALQEVEKTPLPSGEKQDQVEASPNDSKGSSERKDRAKSSSSDTDTKRAKQQFAQRSRVRKLQYIAELERNVQALQLEGSEVSAEIGFLNQQNLILSMENKALEQRLESLAQEQLIKYMEHEVLEREIVRLRALYQQQQQQQQPQSSSTHQRSNSKDLDSQFAKLSLKHKGSTSSRVTLT